MKIRVLLVSHVQKKKTQIKQNKKINFIYSPINWYIHYQYFHSIVVYVLKLRGFQLTN